MPTAAEDRDEILQVMYRYNHAMDRGNADEWASCFTADAVFDAAGRVTEGHDALRALAQEVGGKGIRHVLVNPAVDVDGDAARGRSYLLLLQQADIGAVGAYDDEFVRTGDGWKIAKRVFTIESRADAPA